MEADLNTSGLLTHVWTVTHATVRLWKDKLLHHKSTIILQLSKKWK